MDLGAIGLHMQFSVGLQDDIAQSATDNGCVVRVLYVNSFLPGPRS